MKIPSQIFQKLQPQYQAGLNPLLQIELKGGVSLDQLFQILNNEVHIDCNIIKADIEFSGKESFGTLLVFLQGNSDENEKAMHLFSNYKFKSNLIGYA